jgi:hypothetical protein
MSDETILVRTTDVTIRRGDGPKELKVDILADNVNLFLSKVETILEKAPKAVGQFKFTEFSVCAEVSADGKLVLMGTGMETGIRGSLTFKFERKA